MRCFCRHHLPILLKQTRTSKQHYQINNSMRGGGRKELACLTSVSLAEWNTNIQPSFALVSRTLWMSYMCGAGLKPAK
ncbi:unnamed protein product [Dicrocoelium dendriticum]|nr:unnamed protein product [Dicrocoelium dendriticum]